MNCRFYLFHCQTCKWSKKSAVMNTWDTITGTTGITTDTFGYWVFKGTVFHMMESDGSTSEKDEVQILHTFFLTSIHLSSIFLKFWHQKGERGVAALFMKSFIFKIFRALPRVGRTMLSLSWNWCWRNGQGVIKIKMALCKSMHLISKSHGNLPSRFE